MGILVLINITACLALIDIALKSTIEGYMTQKEERTACGGKLILRKVYNKGMCMNLLEDHQEVVKYGSAFVDVFAYHLSVDHIAPEKSVYFEEMGTVFDDSRSMEQHI